jgi:hypothetical protein
LQTGFRRKPRPIVSPPPSGTGCCETSLNPYPSNSDRAIDEKSSRRGEGFRESRSTQQPGPSGSAAFGHIAARVSGCSGGVQSRFRPGPIKNDARIVARRRLAGGCRSARRERDRALKIRCDRQSIAASASPRRCACRPSSEGSDRLEYGAGLDPNEVIDV